MKPRSMNRSVRWLVTTGLLLAMILTLAGPAASVARAASFVVTNLNDSGKGSLRQAISDANAAAGADTITFSLSGTILLGSTLPAISDVAGLTIDGAGQSITISGNEAVRVLFVNTGAVLTLRHLTITGGYVGTNVVPRGGGGIANDGTLTVVASSFSGNNAGEGGNGGAIFNDGTLTVTGSTFWDNTAFVGGAIRNYFGTVTIADSAFSENYADYGGVIRNEGTLIVTGSTFAGNDAFKGGGIIIDGGTATVTGSTFSGNTASADGGGMINYGGTLAVTDSAFSGNSATNGGGIYNGSPLAVTGSTFSGNEATNGGGIISFGTLEVTGSTFSDNTAYSGGGINSVGPLEVTDSTFSGNEATNGGGMVIAGTLTMTGSTFSANSASSSGGGIYNNGGTLEVTDSTFSESYAGFSGGGILNGGFSNSGTLNVTNTTFADNRTGSQGGGGGIYSWGTLQVADSTFSGNRAYFFGGGGIYTDSPTATVANSTFSNNSTGDSIAGGGAIYNDRMLDVTNSTFSGNGATQGGAISNGSGIFDSAGMLSVTSSTFSGNFATINGGGIYNHGTATLSLQNTLVADSTSVNCTNDGSLIDGGGNLSWPDTSCPGLNAAPLLGPLQDNGGPTQTHALLPDSPAIDAAVLANCPATDQRGVTRPQGAGCDIGAFELERVVYDFSGFFPPVDNLPTMNVVRAGASVPVKFSLNGDQGLDIFAAGYPVSQQIVCESGTPQDDIEETVTAGSSGLSYDAASDTYTYLWKTNRAWANTCRQLNVRLDDGTEHMANFKFVR